MGIEIQVTSLEEMCDLMCDNKIPEHEADHKSIEDEEFETGQFDNMTGSMNLN